MFRPVHTKMNGAMLLFSSTAYIGEIKKPEYRLTGSQYCSIALGCAVFDGEKPISMTFLDIFARL